MSGAYTRNRGKRGEREAKDILTSRDWVVADLTDGEACEDFLVFRPDDKQLFAVEVKNTKSISVTHRDQAKTQAKNRKAKWMLMSKIYGTGSWLIQSEGEKPRVWHGGQDEN